MNLSSHTVDEGSLENTSTVPLIFRFLEARERSVKAISFAKLLRKDLEVSAEFSLSRSTEDVLSRLHHTGHVQVS